MCFIFISGDPANKIPYVAKEDTASIYNIPKLKSFIDRPGPYFSSNLSCN